MFSVGSVCENISSKKGEYALVYGGDVPNAMDGFSNFGSRWLLSYIMNKEIALESWFQYKRLKYGCEYAGIVEKIS